MKSHYPDPASAARVSGEQTSVVAVQVAVTDVFSADGARIRLSAALAGTPAILAGTTVEIGYSKGAIFVTLAALTLDHPFAALDIESYGPHLLAPIQARSASGAQNVCFATVRNLNPR